jgi:hypothetical protein
MSQSADRLPFADDLIDAISRWRDWMRDERRVAAKTVESYSFDLHNLLRFLNRHRGRQINLAMLAGLSLADFRSLPECGISFAGSTAAGNYTMRLLIF